MVFLPVFPYFLFYCLFLSGLSFLLLCFAFLPFLPPVLSSCLNLFHLLPFQPALTSCPLLLRFHLSYFFLPAFSLLPCFLYLSCCFSVLPFTVFPSSFRSCFSFQPYSFLIISNILTAFLFSLSFLSLFSNCPYRLSFNFQLILFFLLACFSAFPSYSTLPPCVFFVHMYLPFLPTFPSCVSIFVFTYCPFLLTLNEFPFLPFLPAFLSYPSFLLNVHFPVFLPALLFLLPALSP